MMKHFFILGTLLLAAPLAYGKKALKSHVHGHVKLSVVVDKKQAFIELEGPAESFLGLLGSLCCWIESSTNL